MSTSNLTFQTLTTPPNIDRMINSDYRRFLSRMIYSNRFIPSRSGSNFALFDLSMSPSKGGGSNDGAPSFFTTLLKTALFGPDSAVVRPLTPNKVVGLDGKRASLMPPTRNIFRYKSETKQSMHSLSPFGSEDLLPGPMTEAGGIFASARNKMTGMIPAQRTS